MFKEEFVGNVINAGGEGKLIVFGSPVETAFDGMLGELIIADK